MRLTNEERSYLIKKIEYTKKQKMNETKNRLFIILNEDVELTKEDKDLIIKSLESRAKLTMQDSDIWIKLNS